LKEEQTLAQDSLGRAPDVLQKVLSELASSETDRRTIAAEWSGRLRIPAAIEALISAIKREDEVKPRAAMLAALDSLGGSLDPFLDRNALGLDATHGLSKGIPAELDWFPFTDLPQLHWKETGEPLPPEIAK